MPPLTVTIENTFRTYYLVRWLSREALVAKPDNLSHPWNHMAEELTSTRCPLTSTQMSWHSSAYTHK